MKVKKNISYVSVALSLMWSGIYANAAEQYLLDTSVVSASGFAQDVKDAPASISVITKEELESRPVQDIAEAISDIPGVNITKGKTGTYDFTIRGFGTGYTLVLVDGKRQNTVNGFHENGFSGVDNSYLPPISMIERIEVIKGPASTLYGGDAIGGVVNIITKKNPDKFTGSISIETQAQQHYNLYGHGRGVTGYMAFPLIKDKLSLALRGKYYGKDHSNLKWPDKTLTNQYASHSPGEYKIGNVGARLNWKINDQNNLYLDGEHYYQYSDTMNTSGRQVRSTSSYNRDGLILNHDGYYTWGTTNTYAQYQYTDQTSKSGTPVANESTVYVVESKAIMPFDFNTLGSVMLTTGAQYQWEGFRNDSGTAATNIHMGQTLDQNIIAPYAEAEYSITENLILTGGLRYTYSDLFEGEFIPRGYLVYHLTDWVTLKGGVAKGYKTPQAKQLGDGVYRVDGGDIHGNSKLNPETSTNYEIGAIFDVWDYGNLSITAFQTDFKNSIDQDPYADGESMPNGQICSGGTDGCKLVVNRGKDRARGVEVGMDTATWNGFSANVSYTYMEKHDKSGDYTNPWGGTRYTNLPRHIAVVKLNYTKGKFSSFLKATGRYDTLAQSKGGRASAIPGMMKYKDFYILDLGFSYKMTKSSTINFVINNLLDKDFFEPYRYEGSRGTSYANRFQDYTEGRNFWINYKLDF